MPEPLGALASAWINRKNRNTAERRAARDEVAGRRPAVVVSGGSRGIGLELARAFHRNGCTVLLVARGEGALAEAVATFVAADQARVITLVCDITSVTAAETINDRLSRAGCYLDILVNNAGAGASGPFAGNAPEDLEHLMATNVAALTRLTRAALPGMIARGAGGILTVASLGGAIPGPNQAAYYASKAYAISLTEALAREVSGCGVRVSVLAPGPVGTGFHAAMGADRAYYRLLLPELSAARVAISGYRGFTLGQRLIIPGVLYRLVFVVLRVVPHPISVPLTGWLLRNSSR